eukprot:TRINITY_DN24992_c0_g1_i1.p1 TRINITY_DN24992_c0_g1~~TRINITY_DN24992_c0_g1_i1.p1  ORF type:complete len:557 (-),score=124.36 TRINITY_DN24992_c0_g1_i1:59-1687(-)
MAIAAVMNAAEPGMPVGEGGPADPELAEWQQRLVEKKGELAQLREMLAKAVAEKEASRSACAAGAWAARAQMARLRAELTLARASAESAREAAVAPEDGDSDRVLHSDRSRDVGGLAPEADGASCGDLLSNDNPVDSEQVTVENSRRTVTAGGDDDDGDGASASGGSCGSASALAATATAEAARLAAAAAAAETGPLASAAASVTASGYSSPKGPSARAQHGSFSDFSAHAAVNTAAAVDVPPPPPGSASAASVPVSAGGSVPNGSVGLAAGQSTASNDVAEVAVAGEFGVLVAPEAVTATQGDTSTEPMAADHQAQLAVQPVRQTEEERVRRQNMQLQVRALRHELLRWQHQAELLERDNPVKENDIVRLKAELTHTTDILESTRNAIQHNEVDRELRRNAEASPQPAQGVPLLGGGHGGVEVKAERGIRQRCEQRNAELSSKAKQLMNITASQQLLVQRLEKALLYEEGELEQKAIRLSQEKGRKQQLKDLLRRRSDDAVASALGVPGARRRLVAAAGGGITKAASCSRLPPLADENVAY